MTVFPVLLDSKPDYLGVGTALSLLQLPLGAETLLDYFGRPLQAATSRRSTIIRTFDAATDYDTAIAASGLVGGRSVPADDFPATIQTAYEPSDWLLVVDPRCFSLHGFDPAPLLADLETTPRMARHLIALDHGTAGTNERVELDDHGRVRRVQRYYDAVTWTITRGVICSLVPVSAFTTMPRTAFESAADLRRALAAAAVPSRDLVTSDPIVDLSSEHALLAAQDRLLTASSEYGTPVVVYLPTTDVHPSARLTGSVVVHTNAEIGEDAMVIGPAVIGAGARVGPGAIVAQCLVAPGASVPEGAVVRHRLVTAGLRPVPSAPTAEDVIEDVQVVGRPDAPPHGIYPAVKTLLEALVAIVALLVLSPLLLVVAALVKLDSQGPVLYGDPRESKDGKVFRCFKFRTMRAGAAAAQRDLMAVNQVDGPQFKMERDPRVTRVGRWLRATSLDELPQLLNVAAGQMSLVGPRPSPFRENQTCVSWREARLSVRPGITGLWQVCRHDRQLGDFHQWIYYDIQYVRHMSFWVDLKIIAATIVTLGGKGHVPLSWIISSATEHA